MSVSSVQAATSAPGATDTIEAGVGPTETVRADLPTATAQPTRRATTTSSPSPERAVTASATTTLTPTNKLTPTQTLTATPLQTATRAVTATATVTRAANASPVPGRAAPTPCYGAVMGAVVVDVNGNGKMDAGEPGLAGATLVLRGPNGIIGLYTTGNGQFSFPGVAAGNYELSESAPAGYTHSGPPAYNFEVACNSAVTRTFLNVSVNLEPTPTLTPTSNSKITPVPNAQVTPRSSSNNASNFFTAFSTGAVFDLAGCGSITEPGLYRLTTSLVSQWDCIQIYSDNVILDCQGNSLNGTDMNGYGIVVHHVGNIFSKRAPRNIEIRNCHSSKHKYGIFIDAADNLYLHHNNISGNFTDVDPRGFGQFLGLPEGGGIRVGDTRNALISNNTTDRQAIGIDVRSSARVSVRNNSASGNTAWGVHLYNTQYSEVIENTTKDNVRYCTWGSGVVGPGCDAGGIMLQSGSSFNVVRGNIISGSNGNGIFIKAHGTPCGDSNVIANNQITGAMYNAIELSFCRDNKLQGNQISGSLDGIWMGFAQNNTVNGGNELFDLSNHGIISWNSRDNNISTNRITNSREGLYFYSSEYKKDEFFFVQGSPEDHVSRGNCLCDNQLTANAAAAIHLNNSLKNQITHNRLVNNGVNFLMEGNTSGNIIQDNMIEGGSFDPRAPRPRYASWNAAPDPLQVYDRAGRALERQALVQALESDSPLDSFSLRWFKHKLRVSLGLPVAPRVSAEPGDLADWLWRVWGTSD